MKIGIDIGGSHIALAIVDRDKIINKQSIYTRNLDIFTRKNMKEYILKNIFEYIDTNIDIKELDMIGISSAGEIQDGIIYNAQNLGIIKFDIKGQLIKRYSGVKILVQNDALSALNAEMKFGNLKNSDTSVFMCIGTGIGFAYIYDNNVFKLHNMYGIDIGHMIIEKDGILCTCGKKGCFEKYATMRRLKRNLKQELKIYEDIKVSEILEKYYNNNEAVVQKIVKEYISYLITGIANIVELFKPKKICIGGSFANLENTIVWKELQKQYNELKTYSKIQKPILVTAKYKNDAGIIGSVI